MINEPTHIELNRNNVPFEIRKLNIGDFCWIARCKTNPTVELVLPYVIERKRMDDFGSSIKDGRFHEQKFRLRQCGIENLIYLVENYGTNQHCGLPLSTLQQAATNTKIQDKFIVKYTECLAHSVSYISTFTQVITNLYQVNSFFNIIGYIKPSISISVGINPALKTRGIFVAFKSYMKQAILNKLRLR